LRVAREVGNVAREVGNVAREVGNVARGVSDQLRRGDLLCYATNTSDPNTIHYVAIYIGNGMMVNAPHTGAFVRIDSMYAPGGLIGAVRPAGRRRSRAQARRTG
jgi:cell wall-associated NlpC family hydrolase